jgi:hypothetical protein
VEHLVAVRGGCIGERMTVMLLTVPVFPRPHVVGTLGPLVANGPIGPISGVTTSDAENHWPSGLGPSIGIPNARKHTVSGNKFSFRPQGSGGKHLLCW